MACALKRMRGLWVSRAWNKWYESAMESKECARQMQRAVMRLVAAELSKSFGQWREVAASTGTAKRLLGGALAHMVLRSLSSGWNKWHARTMESKECAQKEKRALMWLVAARGWRGALTNMSDGVLRRAWTTWWEAVKHDAITEQLVVGAVVNYAVTEGQQQMQSPTLRQDADTSSGRVLDRASGADSSSRALADALDRISVLEAELTQQQMQSSASLSKLEAELTQQQIQASASLQHTDTSSGRVLDEVLDADITAEALVIVLEHVRHSSSRRVVGKWRHVCSHAMQSKRSWRQAVLWQQWQLGAQVVDWFWRWREATSALGIAKQRMACALKRMRGLWVSRAWNKWYASAMESKECARQMQRAVMRLVAAELSKSFGQWREVASSMGTAARLMGGAVKRLMEEGLSRAWNKWHASAMESKESARLVQRALMRLVAAELSKSFGQWREVAASMGTAARLMGGAVKRMMLDGIGRAWNKWHASALESKECARQMQRALMRLVSAALSKSFGQWQSTVSSLLHSYHLVRFEFIVAYAFHSTQSLSEISECH
jgi:hypothetical protein